MKDDYQSSSGIIKAHLSVSSLFYKSFINILDKCQSSGVAYLSVDIKLAIFRPKTLYLSRYMYVSR